jgi:hypothetical protein
LPGGYGSDTFPAESARPELAIDHRAGCFERAGPAGQQIFLPWAEGRDDAVSAALVINPTARTDTLLIASADGSAEASAAQQVITAAEASQHRSVTVTDIVPLQRGDSHGLTGFYLVVGWAVGGYLAAALLGMASGAPPRAINRLIAFVPYAIISGLAGAIVVGPVLGALAGHLIACGGSARCWCSRSAPSPWPSRPCSAS